MMIGRNNSSIHIRVDRICIFFLNSVIELNLSLRVDPVVLKSRPDCFDSWCCCAFAKEHVKKWEGTETRALVVL
jgi:hypothetical protein